MSTHGGRRIAQVVAGLVVGLGLAEAAFWIRDDGAFPHVAFYVADAALGARLRPDASQRIAFGGNPTTTITTNSLGYRGDPWPPRGPSQEAAAAREVLVVGDSQVYGLGVEHEATFASVLATTAKASVLNAGVPTYGPFEYAAVVDEVLATRKPSHVVFVVNLANDLFEATRKNVERHAIWDGWAVRSETMPTDHLRFPGRELLFSKSHLVFALRKLATPTLPPGDDRGFPSEGGWQDLATTALQAHPPPPPAEALVDERDPAARARDEAARALEALDHRLDRSASELLDVDVESAVEEEAVRIAAPRGAAHDIVVSRFAESGREIAETASILLAGAKLRRKHEGELRALATRTKNVKVLEMLDARAALALKLDELARPGAHEAGAASPLRETLERVKRSCDAAGARLIVVALPLDVMVSAEEWRKYDVSEHPDMSETAVLVEDILADAKAIGAVGLDATPALRAAEPGAFLDADLHMSAKGHAALAAALLPKLDELPPLAKPRPGLPADRSLAPVTDEWARVLESSVKGSTAAACETKQVREWLRVSCHRTDALVPIGVNLQERVVDSVALSGGTSAVLITPLTEGARVSARFLWRDHSRVLVADWPAGAAAPVVAFGEREAKAALDDEGQRFKTKTSELCRQPHGSPWSALNCDLMNGIVIDQAIGGPRAISFDRYVHVVCADDEARAGALPTCAKLCDADRPCAKGRCEPWLGAQVCR